MRTRCEWCGDDPLYVAYHDQEWGVPVHADQRLFEMLTLEGAQAGLSWLTILRKREAYRLAFAGFDPARVAACSAVEVTRLLANPGIVRNRLKIESVIRNARCILRIQAEFGSLDSFLWRYVDGQPRHNACAALARIPSRSEESDRMSRDLKRRGLSFVGTTICYALMQAVGMVNDHVVACFRHGEIMGLSPPRV
jgi:DNA-3-methyladenine glycosylase I